MLWKRRNLGPLWIHACRAISYRPRILRQNTMRCNRCGELSPNYERQINLETLELMGMYPRGADRERDT